MQLVLGGLVRHTDSSLAQRGHLLAAFVVVAAVVWLVKLVLDEPTRTGSCRRPSRCWRSCWRCRFFLGVEAWMSKFVAAV